MSTDYPDIPPWEVVDEYSGVKFSLTFTEDCGPQLTMSHGDPNDGPYQVMRVDIESDALARLVRDHVEPLLAWERVEAQRLSEKSECREAARRAEADEFAWVTQTGNVPLGQTRLHRNGCAVLKRSGSSRRGEHTFGGSHGGQEVLRLLRTAEEGLIDLVGERYVRAKLHTLSLRDAGRRRDTKPDRRPLVLCGMCKPFGAATADLMAEIARLADVTEVLIENEGAVATLMGRMRALVPEVEAEHAAMLLRLRGDGAVDDRYVSDPAFLSYEGTPES